MKTTVAELGTNPNPFFDPIFLARMCVSEYYQVRNGLPTLGLSSENTVFKEKISLGRPTEACACEGRGGFTGGEGGNVSRIL